MAYNINSEKNKRGSVRLMGKVGLKPKRYSCLTVEQQKYYSGLPLRQRTYIDYRGQNYSKSNSYRMAGYDGKNVGQASYMLEARNSAMKEIIEVLQRNKKAKEITKDDSPINQTIDALAKQKSAEQMLEAINGMDGETARRVQFFRDIVSGKIKTVRKTKKFNAVGALVETRVEEVSDIDMRIKARKELDRILGLNSIVDLDKLQMGDITINIVDASKKEELEDSRNSVNLNVDGVEVIDGEEVIVEEEFDEKEKLGELSKSEEFFESVEG